MMNQRILSLSLRTDVYVGIFDCIVLFSLFVLFRFVSFRRISSLIIHTAQAPTHTVTHTYTKYEFFVCNCYTQSQTVVHNHKKKYLLHCS